jgi:hypothetical protein
VRAHAPRQSAANASEAQLAIKVLSMLLLSFGPAPLGRVLLDEVAMISIMGLMISAVLAEMPWNARHDQDASCYMLSAAIGTCL